MYRVTFQSKFPQLLGYIFNPTFSKVVLKISWLTVTTHASSYAFLEPAILTTVPVDAKNITLLVFGARPILDLLLDRTSKETLQIKNVVYNNRQTLFTHETTSKNLTVTNGDIPPLNARSL